MSKIKLFAYVFLLIICLVHPVSAQHTKLTLDSAACENWTTVQKNANVSPDGKFLAYIITNNPSQVDSLIIQASDNSWRVAVGNARIKEDCITTNSNELIFSVGKDSLAVFSLVTKKINYITGVASFDLLHFGMTSWLLYQLENETNKKYLFKIGDKENVVSYPEISRYFFDKATGRLVFISSNDKKRHFCLNLKTGKTNAFTVGGQVIDLLFAGDKGMVLTSKNATGQNGIWKYQEGADVPTLLITDDDKHLDTCTVISGLLNVTGRFVVFKTVVPELQKYSQLYGRKAEIINVTVNSYKDPYLKSESSYRMVNKEYVYALDMSNLNCMLIGHSGNGRNLLMSSKHANIWIIREDNGVGRLVALNENKSICLPGELLKAEYLFFNPKEDHVLFFDEKKECWFSFDIAHNRLANICGENHIKWHQRNLLDNKKSDPFVPLAWFKNGNQVMLQDGNSDIYIASLSGQSPLISISKDLAKKNNLTIKIIGRPSQFNSNYDPNCEIVSNNQILYFSAFNFETKNISYLELDLKGRRFLKPIFTTSGVCDEMPIKASNSNSFVVMRMSAAQSPNYFFTPDFKNYLQLSQVYPEKKYNWITSELILTKTRNLQPQDPEKGVRMAILYKPENFDRKKKYPVIINYYERKSDDVHRYIEPALASDEINVPWFVTRGYIVCCVDMHYEIGKVKTSVLKGINMIMDTLVRLNYVDSTKIGLQGHSFGGYETNLIVANSHRFKAAVSAAGVSDLFSIYASLWSWGASFQHDVEKGQLRNGSSLWEDTQSFISNSPIFNVPQITTPLLLLGNEDDNRTPIQQTREFFIALKRFRKPVWLLQYRGEKHTIFNKVNRADYTTRIEQFFDYYLKDKPAPLWMTATIPANEQKETKKYFQYDLSGAKP